jgi:hypothetical protein
LQTLISNHAEHKECRDMVLIFEAAARSYPASVRGWRVNLRKSDFGCGHLKSRTVWPGT